VDFVDNILNIENEKIILGEEKFRPTKANKQLVQELLSIGKENENKNGLKQVTIGKTLCADDFYEGQGRVDGAFCEYTIESKFKFLQKCYDSGIKNIEM
jgi:uridine phosphorylase